eukprot:gene1076-1166_t
MVKIVHKKLHEFGEIHLTCPALHKLLSQSFDECDDGVVADNTSLEKLKAYEIRPHYVPFIDLPMVEERNINAIINSRDRVYLKAEEKALAFDDHMLGQLDEISSSSSRSRLSFDYRTRGELDLGLEPLQKVVYKMKKLQSEAQQMNVDRYKPVKANIMPYCDYLLGDNPRPKPRRPIPPPGPHWRTDRKTYTPGSDDGSANSYNHDSRSGGRQGRVGGRRPVFRP